MWSRRVSLVIAAALLSAAAMTPQPGWLAVGLACAGPALLLVGLRGTASRSESALLGVLWGMVFFGLSLAPLAVAVGWVLAALAIVACALVAGVGGVVFTREALRVGDHPARWRRALEPLVVAGAWTAVEWLRVEFPCGLAFPWLLAGEPLAASGRLIQLASLGGPLVLSFAVLVVAAALARPSRPALAVAAAVVVAALGYGEWCLERLGPALGPGPAVAVVTDADWSGAADAGQAFPAAAGRLTQEAARDGADLVVWPETALASSVDEYPASLAAVSDVARAAGVDLLVGAYSGVEGEIRNTAIHVDRAGKVQARFHKQWLVPLAEALPDASSWPRLRAALEGLVPEEFEPLQPGRERVASSLSSAGKGRIGALICYEAQHPAAAAEAVAAGADLLVAVANEERFAGTLAVTIMERHARLRAVETRCPLIRAVSGARSLLIDPLGRARELRQGEPVVVPMLRAHAPPVHAASSRRW